MTFSDTPHDQPAGQLVTFSAADVASWRMVARQRLAHAMPESAPHGWSICPVDPGTLLSAFPLLEIRPGFRFAAYQYRMGRDGSTAAFAIPSNADLPAVDDPASRPDHPAVALPHPLDAVSGDGSAMSYMQASMFSRELEEFGALGHGVQWGYEHVLDDDLWNDPGDLSPSRRRPASPRQQYRWNDRIPDAFGPTAVQDDNGTVVRFHTYTALDLEHITAHCDRYPVGEYSMMTTSNVIATGHRGFKI